MLLFPDGVGEVDGLGLVDGVAPGVPDGVAPGAGEAVPEAAGVGRGEIIFPNNDPGWQGIAAADLLRVPTVAVYQTDLAGYAIRYGLPRLQRAAWRWLRQVHGRAGRAQPGHAQRLAGAGRLGGGAEPLRQRGSRRLRQRWRR